MLLTIIDPYLPVADHLERIAMHHDGCALINSDAQNLWMHLYNLHKVMFAPACIHVLVDGGIRKQSKSSLVISDHDAVISIRHPRLRGVSAHEK